MPQALHAPAPEWLATATKTPGPNTQADLIEELARAMVRDHSPRTLARCRRASTLLLALGPETQKYYLTTSTVDGAVNVSKLLRLAEDEVLRQIAKVHGLDSGTVHNLRAGYLSVVLKTIRARQKPNADLNVEADSVWRGRA